MPTTRNAPLVRRIAVARNVRCKALSRERPNRFLLSEAAVFTWAVAACLAMVIPARAGSIRYPALGNVNLHEGTLELWLTPTVPLHPHVKPGGYAGPLSLFNLTVPGQFHVDAGWIVKGRQDGTNVARLSASIHDAKHHDALLPLLAEKSVPWKQGQRHLLAFTWKGRQMSLWADGKRICHRKQAAGFSGLLGNSELVIGNMKNHDAHIIVHAVRVSRTAHDAQQLENAVPKAQIDTLLLDRFGRPSITKVSKGHPLPTTHAQVIGGLFGEKGGKLEGGWYQVKGPHGGIALNEKSK